MAVVPQRRTSKTRKRLRRTHFKLRENKLIICSHCGRAILPHNICIFCGYYKNKEVLNFNKKKKNERK